MKRPFYSLCRPHCIINLLSLLAGYCMSRTANIARCDGAPASAELAHSGLQIECAIFSVWKKAWICILLLHFSPGSQLVFGAESFVDIKLTPDSHGHAEENGELRSDALETAEILRIVPYVQQIRLARQSAADQPGTMSRATLYAKYLCLLRILAAREEVRKFVVALKRDLATSYVALDTLTTRNDVAQDVNNSLNFMQFGIIGIVKQSLLIEKKFAVPPYLLTTANAVGTGSAALNLAIPSLCGKKVTEPRNTFADFLDLNYNPPDANRSCLWRFLNSPIPGGDKTLTRRQILLKHFTAFQGLNLNNKRYLKKLTASPRNCEILLEHANVVAHRISLLFDLRSHVEEFDLSLYELHKSIISN